MIIITGATGFVGRRLVKRVANFFPKSQILCFLRDKHDTYEKESQDSIKKAELKMKFVDLVSGKGLQNLPRSLKLIFHLAANTDTADPDHRCNDVGTQNLLKAIGKVGPETHFIFTSTLVMMGGRDDCSKPINESTTPIPTNEYTRSKLRTEEILKKSCRKNKFRLTIVRFNTVYGPSPKPRSLFSTLKRMILRNSIFTRLNWPGLSSIIYVEDVVNALFLLANKPPKPGIPELYILDPESLTIAQMSKLIHKALGIKYRPIYLPKKFWEFFAYTRRFVPLFEKVTPSSVYSWLWRASLIVDNVIFCKTNKIYKAIPNWKPRRFSEIVREVIV